VSRERVRSFAAEALARGEPLAWFEQVYASAADEAAIPWADLAPNPELVEWLETHDASPGRALVVACGLGDDAEELARHGYEVTAFDLAPSAIAWCRRRFPQSPVAYVVANALAPPPEWEGAFDLVFEAYTLQSLPEQLRKGVAATVVRSLAPAGVAVAVARGRDEDERVEGPPWPLTPAELRGLLPGLDEVALDDRVDSTGIRRLRLVVRRPA
jgi:SAM-dependent methyltransferase